MFEGLIIPAFHGLCAIGLCWWAIQIRRERGQPIDFGEDGLSVQDPFAMKWRPIRLQELEQLCSSPDPETYHMTRLILTERGLKNLTNRLIEQEW